MEKETTCNGFEASAYPFRLDRVELAGAFGIWGRFFRLVIVADLLI